MPPVNDKALSLKSVSKSFISGQTTINAIKDITLSIKIGQITALVGPDGAGKTTLLRLAAGLLLPDSGSVSVFSLDSDKQSEQIHHLMGYMPQRFGLYEDLSVIENLNLYADLHELTKKERQHRFLELTKMSGLSPFNNRLAGQLSGGMKQKLGLACTLLSQPKLLLLDEPSVGVDTLSRRELWHIIEQQVSENGMTVLMSTAYMDEAEHCNEVILMDAGECLEQNTPDFFKHKMQGLCFTAMAENQSIRQLQLYLGQQDKFIDAIIQGDKVRVVVRQGATLEQITGIHFESTKPRLEDAFIGLLQSRYQKIKPVSPKTNQTIASISTEDIIRVDHVDRWFGQFQAVKALSFTVKRGEIFGLLGANGAGKTTTFRMLCGLLPVSNGQLSVAGIDLRTAAAKARARIGYMSQKFSLYSHLSVRQNLIFFSSAYGLRKSRQQQRVQWALQFYELEPYSKTNSGDLPLGYKQRLAMACALMHEPEILFLDEPTSGVDPLARREFWMRTNQLAATGVTVLVTTHFMEEAEYCDRLVIMVEGDILTSGTPAEIKQQVRNEKQPEPTMEDAFIHLVTQQSQQ